MDTGIYTIFFNKGEVYSKLWNKNQSNAGKDDEKRKKNYVIAVTRLSCFAGSADAVSPYVRNVCMKINGV